MYFLLVSTRYSLDVYGHGTFQMSTEPKVHGVIKKFEDSGPGVESSRRLLDVGPLTMSAPMDTRYSLDHGSP